MTLYISLFFSVVNHFYILLLTTIHKGNLQFKIKETI